MLARVRLALPFLTGLVTITRSGYPPLRLWGILSTFYLYPSLLPSQSFSPKILTNRHDNDAATAVPPAPAADNDTDDSEDEAGEAPINNVNFNVTEHLPPLPSSNLTFSAATFVNDSVREQAELLEDLRAYLLHAEYKAQRGDPAGGLELISHALNLISGRFEVLQVEDASDFRTAKRFKLYQQKSLLTSRPFKQAVADMAAMDRAASGYARVNRGENNAPMPFLPKRGPPPTANFPSVSGLVLPLRPAGPCGKCLP
ncbi:unnamed protein product [Closterium sp. NIES-53]